MLTSRTVRKASVIGAALGSCVAASMLLKNAARKRRNRSLQPNQTIIIAGAGFAGLNVAQELARLLPGDNEGHIRLIDRNNFLLFTPMLTEVAGGELDARHIVAPPRQLSPRINFEQGDIREIRLPEKTVVLDAGPQGGPQRTIKADHIVIALGSVTEYHDIPGLREHSYAMKSIADAVSLRNQIFRSLEQARWETDAKRRREILTFVVGGGGFTGVETMAAVNDLVRGSLRHYPGVRADEVTTIIIEPGERLLAEITPDLAAYAREKLEEHGVQVLLKTKIASAAADFVETEDGKHIPTRTLIWAGGVTANPLAAGLKCPHGRHGTIVVDHSLQVTGLPGIWALGDCAQVPKPSHGSYGPTAQNATREGALVARNIVAVMRGEKPRPFDFKTIGEVALVGRHSAVAKIYGRRFCGFPAWAMWRAIYLSKMPGAAQRSRIFADWMLDLIFGRSVSEVPIVH